MDSAIFPTHLQDSPAHGQKGIVKAVDSRFDFGGTRVKENVDSLVNGGLQNQERTPGIDFDSDQMPHK